LISWKEVKILASLSGPLILGNLLNFLLLLVSLTFVGHCGEIELSGAAIANSFAVVTGFSVVVCV
jgi:MATE family multidrug resistance protein